jgi:hypothetical protein
MPETPAFAHCSSWSPVTPLTPTGGGSRAALVDRVHEHARRAPVGRRGAGLADRDVVARVLRVFHALEVDERAVRVDHGDGDVPAVLLAFGERGRRHLLGLPDVDRGAVAGPAILRGRHGSARGQRCN